MKNKLKYILIILPLIVSSCSRQNQKHIDNNIALEELILQEKSESKLSLMYDSVQYIALETSESSILSGMISLAYIDDEDIFIKSNKLMYRFNKDGSFGNKIGAVGQGSNEYIIPYKFQFDNKNNQVIVLVENNSIQFWDYNGTFCQEINLNSDLNFKSFGYHNELLYCQGRRYHDSGGVDIEMVIFNRKGEKLSEYLVYSDKEKVAVTFESPSLFYTFNDTIRYANTFNSYIQSLMLNRVEEYKNLNLNNHQPTRNLTEDISLKSKLLSDYIQVLDILESDKYMFFIIYFNKTLSTLVYDKVALKSILYSDLDHPNNGGGIKNDINDIGNFYPSYINDKKSYGLLHPIHLSEKELVKLNKLNSSSLYNVDFESNPVIVICTETK
ncbi:MAG: 6-bladed beta-propeller [Rikenellaceae bacterium]